MIRELEVQLEAQWEKEKEHELTRQKERELALQRQLDEKKQEEEKEILLKAKSEQEKERLLKEHEENIARFEESLRNEQQRSMEALKVSKQKILCFVCRKCFFTMYYMCVSFCLDLLCEHGFGTSGCASKQTNLTKIA